MHRAAPLALALALALVPSPARAGKGLEIEDEKFDAWIKARLKAAKSGKPELVRIPVSYRSMGWGCRCPDVFIGTSTDTGGGPWLSVKLGPVAELPAYNERFGVVVVAEGRFTGKKDTEDLRGENGEPEEWLYKLLEFEALRFKRFSEKRGGDARARVVLDGAAAAAKVKALADDRPWKVVVGSFPAASKRTPRRLAALRKKLQARKVEGVEVINSRAAPRLFCCYQVVLAGGHKTREAALVAARALRKKRLKGVYVRKGW